MGKATELDDSLQRMPRRTPEERERFDPRPKLRLRQEVLEQAISPAQPVADALGRLAGEGSEPRVALHDPESGATAVAVPLEQYLELVTSYIKDRQLAAMTTDARSTPPNATQIELGIEQVDPQATWLYTGEGTIS